MKPETLSLQGRLHEIERASRFAIGFCQAQGLESPEQRILLLILEELITNTVKHGAAPPEAPIQVSLGTVPGGIELTYRDRGKPFDPRYDVEEPDLNGTLTGRSVGGLGWPLIKFYCVTLDYRREEDCNLLRLVLRLSGAEPPPPA